MVLVSVEKKIKFVFQLLLLILVLTIPSFSWAYCKGENKRDNCTDYGKATSLLMRGDYEVVWKHLSHPLSVAKNYYTKISRERFNKLIVETKNFIEIAGPLAEKKPDLAFYVAATIRRGYWSLRGFGYGDEGRRKKRDLLVKQIRFFELALGSNDFWIKTLSSEILGDINYNGALSDVGIPPYLVGTNYEKSTKYYSMCGDICADRYVVSYFLSSKRREGIKFIKNLKGFPKKVTRDSFTQTWIAERKYQYLWAIYKFGMFGEKKNNKTANNYYELIKKGIDAEPNFKNDADKGDDIYWLASNFTKNYPTTGVSRPMFPESEEVELLLLKKALGKRHAKAAIRLSEKYREGDGVRKDFLRSNALLNLAVEFEKDPEEKKQHRSLLEAYERKWQLTNSQIIYSQQLSGKILKEIKKSKKKKEKPKNISGTGFFVSGNGHIITNQHVISGCRTITISSAGKAQKASIVVDDVRNDVALLKTSKGSSFAFIRGGRGIRQGDDIIAYGFPLSGILSSSAKVTKGTVNSLSGLGDDFRYMQISAPVQPGNSGGPLLDAGGNVVGIITAKINAAAIQKVTGDIPQNINFALKSSVIKDLLDANEVNYETRQFSKEMETPDIVSLASKFTVQIQCEK